MSQTLFEIRRVFQSNRAEISKVNGDQFSMQQVVKELGQDQIVDNLNAMFQKEAGRHSRSPAHDSSDFLQRNFDGKITSAVREEAVLSILQFAVQTQCLDQTFLQAVHLADTYLRMNPSCQPAFVKIIYAMALEISIKNNEQMILSLEDIVSLFEGRFNQAMLANLERHILTLNNFQVNVATSLDYVLNFVYLEREVLCAGSFQLTPDYIVNETLPLLHYAASQYDLSLKKRSSIAVAAICHFLQEAHEDMQASTQQQNGPDYDAYLLNQICEMQQLRDAFLNAIVRKFPELDLEDIQEILMSFKQPFVALAEQNEGPNDYISVTEPWSFNQLQVNRTDNEFSMQEPSQAPGLEMQESLPDISRLSLEKKAKAQAQCSRQPNLTETDGDMVFSTGDTSLQGTGREGRHNLNMASQSSMGVHEESKSVPGNHTRRSQRVGTDLQAEYPHPINGRPSLSESTGAPSKNFSPGFAKISSHTKNPGDENILDDEDEGVHPNVTGFMSSNKTFHGGGKQSSSQQSRAQQRSVDGVFAIGQDVEATDDMSSDIQLREDGEEDDDDDDDEELTYNSQGKPLARKKTGVAGDKKSSRKAITKPPKPKKQPAKPAEGKVKKQEANLM